MPLIQQNGILVNYTVELTPYVTANQTTLTLNTLNLVLEVQNLVPLTRYSITVAAVTHVGTGPRSPIVERETPLGKCYNVFLLIFVRSPLLY